MFGMFGKGLLGNLSESFIDNVIRECVSPVLGSVVYCELAFGNAEHSGVFIGNNKIAHLDGDGCIEIVSPTKFLGRLGGWNSAISIYVSCNGVLPVGGEIIAKRARKLVGHKRSYNVILDNCHQFTSGCLTGNFDNSDNFIWMLKHTASKEINSNSWRVWESKNNQYL